MKEIIAISRLRPRYAFPFLILIVLGGLFWLGPFVVRRVPSRYLARLPQPLQTLTAPEAPAPLLPTVSPPHDVAGLLEASSAPKALPPPLVSITGEFENDATPTASPVSEATMTPSPTRRPLPAAIRLEGFQHQFQTWNNCGPATVAMALSFFGLAIGQQEAAAVLKPDPEDRNVSPHEMVAYVNEYTAYSALWRANGSLETLKQLLAAGFPVIIELGIEPPGEYRWLGWYGHYLLLTAYDDGTEQVWVYDSWFGTSDVPMENATREGRILTYTEVDRQWRQFNRTYVVLYEPARAQEVASIIGADMDDDVMWQSALGHVQAELEQERDNAFLWFNLGSVYVALEQFEKAATAFDQARAIGLPWRMLWYQFGPYEAYLRIGRYDDVILLADTTLKDRPYFEEAYYYKGLALAADGDVAAATENWSRAVDFNPNFGPAAHALEAAAP